MVQEPRLTIVLQNYMRPTNVRAILGALRLQSEPYRLFVWDNSPDGDFCHALADWVVRSTVNVYCAGRYWMMKQADTPYVAGLDDDLLPGPNLVAATIAALKRNGGGLVGVSGVKLKGHYQRSRHIGLDLGKLPDSDTAVDVVKGRYMACATDQLIKNAPHLPRQLDQLATENDILVSSLFRGGVICPDLCAAVAELPTGRESLCKRPDHRDRRETARQVFFGR